MVRLHALELVPDAAGLIAGREDWRLLREAGLPSQLDHRGATNAPHVTIVAAPLLPQEALDLDDELVRRALAVRAQVPDRHPGGWVPHVTLARRVPREDALRAVELLAGRGRAFALSTLRHWDPVAERVSTVAGDD